MYKVGLQPNMAVVAMYTEAVLKAVEQSDKMDGLVKKNSGRKP